MYNCVYCNNTFTRRNNLKRHIVNRKCTFDKLWECQEFIESSLKSQNTLPCPSTQNNCRVDTNNGNINNGNNISISIIINPVSKLEVGYIDPEKMKKFIEEYNFSNSELLMSDYIKDIIHNKEHPENHCVKYLTKRPPTYINVIEKDNKNINVIKNLKDSCELLSEPVLSTLKKKLKECKKVFENDQEFQQVYEDTVSEIYRQLNRDSVKKALKSVLQNDVLNDIEMKITMLNTC